jgi:hypothetical protein
LGTNKIGGSGAARVNSRTEWDKTFAETMTNKTIPASSNTLTDVVKMPSVRKWGSIQGGTSGAAGVVITGAEGILNGYTQAGSAEANAFSTTDGLTIVTSTGTIANTTIGQRYAATRTSRNLNPRLKARVKIDATDLSRMYIGFHHSITTLSASDMPVSASDAAFLIGYRSIDANWQIFTNDGVSPVTTIDTGIAISPGPNTFEIIMKDAPSTVNYSINGADPVAVTTDLPPSIAPMTWHNEISNVSSISRTQTTYYIEMEQDL